MPTVAPTHGPHCYNNSLQHLVTADPQLRRSAPARRSPLQDSSSPTAAAEPAPDDNSMNPDAEKDREWQELRKQCKITLDGKHLYIMHTSSSLVALVIHLVG